MYVFPIKAAPCPGCQGVLSTGKLLCEKCQAELDIIVDAEASKFDIELEISAMAEDEQLRKSGAL